MGRGLSPAVEVAVEKTAGNVFEEASLLLQ
jgi:hypothetical protein